MLRPADNFSHSRAAHPMLAPQFAGAEPNVRTEHDLGSPTRRATSLDRHELDTHPLHLAPCGDR